MMQKVRLSYLLFLPCQSRMLRCTFMAWSAERIVAKDLINDFILVHIIDGLVDLSFARCQLVTSSKH